MTSTCTLESAHPSCSIYHYLWTAPPLHSLGRSALEIVQSVLATCSFCISATNSSVSSSASAYSYIEFGRFLFVSLMSDLPEVGFCFGYFDRFALALIYQIKRWLSRFKYGFATTEVIIGYSYRHQSLQIGHHTSHIAHAKP